MRVELVQAGSVPTLQNKINSAIEEQNSIGNSVQDVDIEVKPEDEETATSFIAILYIITWSSKGSV